MSKHASSSSGPTRKRVARERPAVVPDHETLIAELTRLLEHKEASQEARRARVARLLLVHVQRECEWLDRANDVLKRYEQAEGTTIRAIDDQEKEQRAIYAHAHDIIKEEAAHAAEIEQEQARIMLFARLRRSTAEFLVALGTPKTTHAGDYSDFDDDVDDAAASLKSWLTKVTAANYLNLSIGEIEAQKAAHAALAKASKM